MSIDELCLKLTDGEAAPPSVKKVLKAYAQFGKALKEKRILLIADTDKINVKSDIFTIDIKKTGIDVENYLLTIVFCDERSIYSSFFKDLTERVEKTGALLWVAVLTDKKNDNIKAHFASLNLRGTYVFFSGASLTNLEHKVTGALRESASLLEAGYRRSMSSYLVSEFKADAGKDIKRLTLCHDEIANLYDMLERNIKQYTDAHYGEYIVNAIPGVIMQYGEDIALRRYSYLRSLFVERQLPTFRMLWYRCRRKQAPVGVYRSILNDALSKSEMRKNYVFETISSNIADVIIVINKNMPGKAPDSKFHEKLKLSLDREFASVRQKLMKPLHKLLVKMTFYGIKRWKYFAPVMPTENLNKAALSIDHILRKELEEMKNCTLKKDLDNLNKTKILLQQVIEND